MSPDGLHIDWGGLSFLDELLKACAEKGSTTKRKKTGKRFKTKAKQQQRNKQIALVVLFCFALFVSLWSTLFDTERSRKHGLERCYFGSGSLCWRRHEVGGRVWHKCLLRYEPAFFFSSLVKSEPTWLRPEEVKFEAQKYFCCISIDREPLGSLQIPPGICTFPTFCG